MYHLTQAYVIGQFSPSCIISSEFHWMFYHSCTVGAPQLISEDNTVLGKVPLCASTVVHYKLRITTALVIVVHILSTCPFGVSLRVGVALL